MRIDVLTLFPEMFDGLKHSIVGKALDKNLFDLRLTNIRDFSKNKHKQVDDYPYSGGEGMVMMPEPLYDAIQSVRTEQSHIIYLTPKGTPLKQSRVEELSKMDNLVFICGHYEGIDERIIELCVDEQISIGDYVLTGGELPAMVLIDAISRHIPGVLGNSDSAINESFSDGELEYPLYTRPQEFMGLKVPDVLLSGNHAEIEKWKKQQKKIETDKYRKDLLK